MHSAKNKLFFAAFALVWAGISVLNLLAPTKLFSEAENRYLKTFPSFSVKRLLDGDFMQGVDGFVTDQFVARPYWVAGQSMLEYGLGKREVNGIFLTRAALMQNYAAPDYAQGEDNLAGVKAFAARFNIPTYLLLAPSSTYAQQHKLPRYATAQDEGAFIDAVFAGLSGESGVTPVPVAAALAAGDGYIYYRTDHHWTADGAYIAYSAIADAMGLAAHSREELSYTVLSESFLGTYHSKTGFPLTEPDTLASYQSGKAVEYVVFDGREEHSYSSIYFDEFLDQKDKYAYFLGQVQPYVTVKTAAQTCKKLIIFKDSYAHSVLPLLLSEFDEIRLVDLRFLAAADIEQKLEIERYDAALFLYSTDVFSHQEGAAKLLQSFTD